jgi:hypothetical protein
MSSANEFSSRAECTSKSRGVKYRGELCEPACPAKNAVGVAELRPPSSATALPTVIRERIRAGRDDGATAGAALRFVEAFAVVRQ